jgi:alkylhydroperoxidase/carboxymuconolactone decarboxylase family protein YurZ
VTITSLISLYRQNELPFHLSKALENGITHEEIIATITHVAFYAGWPSRTDDGGRGARGRKRRAMSRRE